MIIKPRVRGFLCTAAHPVGCERDVQRDIAYVARRAPITSGPRNVLIVGASGGYGLASRISAAFGAGANTLGVFFERGADGKRTASPGWYKTAAFTEAAAGAGLYAGNIQGDAFSDEIKQQAIDTIIREMGGKVDLVVYSVAAPARQIPGGELKRSTLKPIGQAFSGKTIDFNTRDIREIALEPATIKETADTVQVMGGEDWELWIDALRAADVLAQGCITTNYTYLGSEVTWPIYFHGTIGKAKEDLDRASRALAAPMAGVGGSARVCVMKGLVTQAAAAIPGMPIYLSLLFKVMQEAGTHEGCIEQTQRLFETGLYAAEPVAPDDAGRLRMDDLELGRDVQDYVKANWNVTAENLAAVADFDAYRDAFLALHGFGIDGVDYDVEVDPVRTFAMEAVL
jgi:enoyl-[acyl-carrier protein] reductase/trans-2-enoyl-CoA reductase (NAD+)